MIILWILFLIISFILFIKLDKKFKKYFLVGWIICFILLLFLSFNNKISFEKYRNTNLENESQVKKIVSLLDINKYKEKILSKTDNKPYSLTIYLNDNISNVDIYQKLEKEALILFSLITNVDEIIFIKNNVSYNYYYENLKSLFSLELHGIDISLIKKRYKEDIFNNDGIYMGTIDGYSIVDESITCDENKEFLKQEENFNYYLKCSDISSIYLYKNNEKYSLQEKINEFSIENLLKTNLNIIKENVS